MMILSCGNCHVMIWSYDHYDHMSPMRNTVCFRSASSQLVLLGFALPVGWAWFPMALTRASPGQPAGRGRCRWPLGFGGLPPLGGGLRVSAAPIRLTSCQPAEQDVSLSGSARAAGRAPAAPPPLTAVAGLPAWPAFGLAAP